MPPKPKQVEDKTFGLKNIQKYVQSLKQSIASKLAAKKKKDEEEKAREAELNENKIKLGCCERLILFKQAISQPKVPVGVDPKSIILCEFFKAGQCQKGFKCKFSHDLNIQRKGEKMDHIYSDKRDEDGTMEEWDQATLEKVVESKKNEYNQMNKQTDIVCKYFLDAVEKKQYGWFWACPNGGKECHYRHALPPGYILKSQMKALLEEESQIEEEIENNERSKLKTSTQMTPALIMECKRKKIAERDAGLAAERAKKDHMSGRELFLSNASLFVDDAEACEEYEREREEEEIEHTSSCPMQISDLPEELESEILCRIPATYLSQLRSTCKRWYALFKDPRFVKKNLGKAAAMQVILKKDDMIYSGIIDIHGICNDFDPSIEFKGQKDSEHVKITKISLCGGLLLCTTKDKRLVVWNPCTGQTRWIQYRGNISCNYLGYEKNNSNYKILSFCIRVNDQTSVAVIEIYEFKSDSWRFLDDITNHWYRYLLSGGGGVSIKGNTYWFDKLKVDHPFNSILVFDFTTERLERLSLPFQSSSSSYNDETVVLSSVREEKLAVLRRRNDLDSLKIWVADTKIDDETKDLSWREILVVDFSKLDIKFPVGFLLDEENKMVVFCDNENAHNFEEGDDRIRIQIVGENIHKEIINESVHDHRPPLLLSYVPSLIQIQQATTGG